MSGAVIKRKFYDSVEVIAADDLVQKNDVADYIHVAGPCEYKRGQVLMSSGDNIFTAATSAGLASAKELCILCEDVNNKSEDNALTYGYFSGVFSQKRLIADFDVILEGHLPLRQHGIYIR
ncbi:MAG: hypothetical protein IJG34_11300 [Synergistaceae bacterium]|nr:hypothetical protein [Synergistaceae bacterium]MBQ3450467.1 hypothetical protein [Synergistaceae bacterium]MBQ3693774.1 hypothetical protein [Synergistaceae bacterium]MBQ6111194.1 hypothetical protein [Synergistaceae bacterium]MBQ9628364.1 hypothetical protein [Synergistaceae bacterium]